MNEHATDRKVHFFYYFNATRYFIISKSNNNSSSFISQWYRLLNFLFLFFVTCNFMSSGFTYLFCDKWNVNLLGVLISILDKSAALYKAWKNRIKIQVRFERWRSLYDIDDFHAVLLYSILLITYGMRRLLRSNRLSYFSIFSGNKW